METKTKPQAIIAFTEGNLYDFAGVLVFEETGVVFDVLKKALQKSSARLLAHKQMRKRSALKASLYWT